MRIFLFKKTAYDCKRATLLSLKKDEGNISLMERWALSYHLRFCDPCRRFIQHSHTIDTVGKRLDDMLFQHPPFTLTDEARDNIRKQLDTPGQ